MVCVGFNLRVFCFVDNLIVKGDQSNHCKIDKISKYECAYLLPTPLRYLNIYKFVSFKVS